MFDHPEWVFYAARSSLRSARLNRLAGRCCTEPSSSLPISPLQAYAFALAVCNMLRNRGANEDHMIIFAILILGSALLATIWAARTGIPDNWLHADLRHSRLARIWRRNAGILLAAYMVLSLATLATAVNSHPPLGCPATGGCQLPPSYQLAWPVVVFLTWRVSRGGRVSRTLLIIWSAAGYAAVATTIARAWSPLATGLLAAQALQIALLTSPAVYQRTRPPGGRGLSSADAMRARPPLWLILAGLFAGLVVTLLYLGDMGYAPIPGCGPPRASLHQLPDRCIGLARGYPLRFLTADQSTPIINDRALIKDWAQWSLVSFSSFYLLWLRRDPGPPPPEPSHVSAEGQPVPE